jgi:hypothetical protein
MPIYTHPLKRQKHSGRTIFELGQLPSPIFRMILRSSYRNKRYYLVYEVPEELKNRANQSCHIDELLKTELFSEIP